MPWLLCKIQGIGGATAARRQRTQRVNYVREAQSHSGNSIAIATCFISDVIGANMSYVGRWDEVLMKFT